MIIAGFKTTGVVKVSGPDQPEEKQENHSSGGEKYVEEEARKTVRE